jgi:hypothetical protein
MFLIFDRFCKIDDDTFVRFDLLDRMFSDKSNIICMKGQSQNIFLSYKFKDIRSTTMLYPTLGSTTSGQTSGQVLIKYQNIAMDNVWECILTRQERFMKQQDKVEY